MSSSTLYRWSGVVLLVGSLLGLVEALLSAVLYPGHNNTSQQILSAPWLIVASLSLVWALLLTMSLPGFYLRQAAHTRVLGFIGFVLIWLGVLLGGIAFAATQIVFFPYLAHSVPNTFGAGSHPPVSALLLLILGPTLLLTVGTLLLGIATLRARVYPRPAGILLLATGIIGLASLPLPPGSAIGDFIEPIWNVVLFLAFAWFGYTLVTQGREPRAAAELSTPATQTGR